MKALFILNDAPYGTEHTYNGLRLAGSLSRQEDTQVRVFLIGDAVASAKAGQKVPQGYYNVATMVGTVLRRGGAVGVCGSCIEARGIADTELLEGAQRSSMDELTAWTLEADKVLVF
jgi:uncharacterized protein involved in oxidation of intracellular sulfur